MPEEENDELRDKIVEQNAEIEAQNELYNKLKLYVKLVFPQGDEENPSYDESFEKCLVRIQNYRDPVLLDMVAEGAGSPILTKDRQNIQFLAMQVEAEQNSKMDTISETDS